MIKLLEKFGTASTGCSARTPFRHSKAFFFLKSHKMTVGSVLRRESFRLCGGMSVFKNGSNFQLRRATVAATHDVPEIAYVSASQVAFLRFQGETCVAQSSQNYPLVSHILDRPRVRENRHVI